jgi:prefoldin alpha subunit
LVPLTSSLYVPGKLSDPENVIIDIGTGYFVSKVSSPVANHPILTLSTLHKSRKEAQKHYASKVEFVKANLEKLQETLEKKQENMNQLLSIMQMKATADCDLKRVLSNHTSFSPSHTN